MAGENDLHTVAFGGPSDEAPAGEPLDVTVTAEEEIIAWPVAKPGLDLTHAQLALYAGWTMAVLYGTISGAAAGAPAELPTVNELPAGQRRKLNLAILTALTARQPKLQLAYQLGRSLRDTANPPGADDTAVAAQLDRRRIAKLQEWLATLSPDFPALTTAAVAGSLGRWSDLAAVTICAGGTAHPRRRVPGLPRLRRVNGDEQVAQHVRAYLLPQGDVWLTLLTDELVTSGLLTPEGYVSAGEAALRRSGAILRGIVRHYWFGLLCVAAALGFTLFLAARYLDGASKVWTSIACIAAALGASVQTIASTSARLAAAAERPVLAVAESDAMAWAITTMPPLALTRRDARQLRRAGLAPPVSLSRF